MSCSPSSRRCAALQLEKASTARALAATRRFLRRWLRAGSLDVGLRGGCGGGGGGVVHGRIVSWVAEPALRRRCCARSTRKISEGQCGLRFRHARTTGGLRALSPRTTTRQPQSCGAPGGCGPAVDRLWQQWFRYAEGVAARRRCDHGRLVRLRRERRCRRGLQPRSRSCRLQGATGPSASARGSSSGRRCRAVSSSSCRSTRARPPSSTASATAEPTDDVAPRTTELVQAVDGDPRRRPCAVAGAGRQHVRRDAGDCRPAPPHVAQRPRGVADQLTFGGPPECPTRQLCLVGLERHVRAEVRPGAHPRRRRAAHPRRR